MLIQRENTSWASSHDIEVRGGSGNINEFARVPGCRHLEIPAGPFTNKN